MNPTYFYVPMEFYQGKSLKCGGVCTPANKEWFLKDNPGVVILEGYRGEIIDSKTLGTFSVDQFIPMPPNHGQVAKYYSVTVCEKPISQAGKYWKQYIKTPYNFHEIKMIIETVDGMVLVECYDHPDASRFPRHAIKTLSEFLTVLQEASERTRKSHSIRETSVFGETISVSATTSR